MYYNTLIFRENNPEHTWYDDILNCIDENDNVEEQLKYEYQPYPHYHPQITALDQNNNKTVNTQRLLNVIFNGSQTDLKESESYNLRKRLLKEIKEYQSLLIEYDELLDCTETHFDNDKETLLRNIKIHLSSTSTFTSFKRQVIKNSAELFKHFGNYF